MLCSEQFSFDFFLVHPLRIFFDLFLFEFAFNFGFVFNLVLVALGWRLGEVWTDEEEVEEEEVEAADLEEIEGHGCGCLDLSFLSFAETFD